jgi:acetyl-CoA synthetase
VTFEQRMQTQQFPIIAKRGAQRPVVPPNMADYLAARRDLDWTSVRTSLGSLPAGGLNIGHVALDRQVAAGLGPHLAVRFVDRRGARSDFSYEQLMRAANRCANALTSLGLARGERVFALLGRGPALHIAALGALKAGMIFCPLFSAFGPEPIRTRVELGEAAALITTDGLYARRIAGIRDQLPGLRHVLIVRTRGGELPPGTGDFDRLLAGATEEFTSVETADDEIALLHFTSGTTGRPKGVLHAHAAVVAHHATARLALDLQPQDRYWCTADPGWVTGMTYGVIAPLTCGVASIVDEEEEFDPERWYRVLADEAISVWYTAPTAIRMLMKAGVELARVQLYPRLRFLASVGEPLNPEAVVWGLEAFGLPFHDNWWQTETGAIMVANFASVDIRPGSMGLPVPGVEAAIVRRAADDSAEIVTEPESVGELALKAGWPSMFRGYLNEEAKYRACFADQWYLSGDLARRDADGYFWFVGRGDDVIKSAGHLISPFEVESALLSHPAVAQAGVIGVPDPIAGAVVKAFVELKLGSRADAELRKTLLAHARRRLGAAVAPRDVAFVEALPRTRSGKIMRRVLRARELGLPEGDLSTLEGGA